MNYQASPGPLTPAPQNAKVVVDAVRNWCQKHSLGKAEYQGLSKLGFHPGDTLETLDCDMWTWAGLGPLHIAHIMAAQAADAKA